MIFNIVFFISLSSVLIQGTTLPTIAKWLHLTLPEKIKHRPLSEIEHAETTKSVLTEIIVPEGCPAIGKQLVELGLPKTTEISIIQRNHMYITPSGSTQIEANDKLFILAENNEVLEKVFECLG
jgi:cell volume regulation protein A